eukprot:358192-Chlamydomonas_euryale.AAC.23
MHEGLRHTPCTQCTHAPAFGLLAPAQLVNAHDLAQVVVQVPGPHFERAVQSLAQLPRRLCVERRVVNPRLAVLRLRVKLVDIRNDDQLAGRVVFPWLVAAENLLHRALGAHVCSGLDGGGGGGCGGRRSQMELGRVDLELWFFYSRFLAPLELRRRGSVRHCASRRLRAQLAHDVRVGRQGVQPIRLLAAARRVQQPRHVQRVGPKAGALDAHVGQHMPVKAVVVPHFLDVVVLEEAFEGGQDGMLWLQHHFTELVHRLRHRRFAVRQRCPLLDLQLHLAPAIDPEAVLAWAVGVPAHTRRRQKLKSELCEQGLQLACTMRASRGRPGGRQHSSNGESAAEGTAAPVHECATQSTKQAPVEVDVRTAIHREADDRTMADRAFFLDVDESNLQMDTFNVQHNAHQKCGLVCLAAQRCAMGWRPRFKPSRPASVQKAIQTNYRSGPKHTINFASSSSKAYLCVTSKVARLVRVVQRVTARDAEGAGSSAEFHQHLHRVLRLLRRFNNKNVLCDNIPRRVPQGLWT